MRPPRLRRDRDQPLTVEEFGARSIDLELAFPLYDATTTAGLSALIGWLPDRWPEALAVARSTHPSPTQDSRLSDLLERGSTRALARDACDADLLRIRRSAFAQLADHLPDMPLHAIDEAMLERLIESYRAGRTDLSSPLLSAHVTELRHLVVEARQEAGMRPLGPAAPPPLRRQGRRSHRPMGTLAEVGTLLRRGARPASALAEVQAMAALILATAALPGHLLRVRAGTLDLLAGRLRVDTWTTRQAENPEGHMIYGLPPWCVRALRACFKGIDHWSPERLLFPGPRSPSKPRHNLAHAWRAAADLAYLPDLRMQDVRRLAQGIHAGAPRAVRRGTATARMDVQDSLSSPEAVALADAQEAYAARIVREWTSLLHPPTTPTRPPPRRARRGTRPEEPEHRGSSRPGVAPRMRLPEDVFAAPDGSASAGASSAPTTSWAPPATAADSQPSSTDSWEVSNHPWLSSPAAWGAPAYPGIPPAPPDDRQFAQLSRETRSAQLRAAAAEQREARVRAEHMPREDAYGLALGVGMGAFAGGAATGAYLHAHPDLLADIGERVGAYAVGVSRALLAELAPEPPPGPQPTAKRR